MQSHVLVPYEYWYYMLSSTCTILVTYSYYEYGYRTSARFHETLLCV